MKFYKKLENNYEIKKFEFKEFFYNNNNKNIEKNF